MLKMKPMKLEGALKLYIALYFLAFLSTFLMSVSTVQYSTVQYSTVCRYIHSTGGALL